MAIVTRATFARMAGVNRVQMTKLINSKKLTAGREGHMDTLDPKNAAYLKKHGVSAKTAKKKSERPIALQKAEADLDLKEAKASRELVGLGRDLGLLLLTSEVRKAFTVFGSEVAMRLLNLPRSISARFGLTHSQEEILAKEIMDAIKQAKEKARRSCLGDFDAGTTPETDQHPAAPVDGRGVGVLP